MPRSTSCTCNVWFPTASRGANDGTSWWTARVTSPAGSHRVALAGLGHRDLGEAGLLEDVHPRRGVERSTGRQVGFDRIAAPPHIGCGADHGEPSPVDENIDGAF